MQRVSSTGTRWGHLAAVRDYLQLLLHDREHEVFVVVLLDAQHRVLTTEELFRGTLTQTSVYPREVVKMALRENAAAVIFAHNHPSGVAEPSRARRVRLRLRSSRPWLLVDIKVLGWITSSSQERLRCHLPKGGFYKDRPVKLGLPFVALVTAKE